MTEPDHADGYPTEAGIEKLLDFHGTPRQLIEYICSIWWPQEDGYVGRINIIDDELQPGARIYEWYIATGGWSGNEEIITQLGPTFFWSRYWEGTKRGGAYTFHVPTEAMDKEGWLGHWQRYPKDPETWCLDCGDLWASHMNGGCLPFCNCTEKKPDDH